MGLPTEKIIRIDFGHLKTINPIVLKRLFQSTSALSQEVSKLKPDLVVTNTARAFVLVGLSRLAVDKVAFIRDYDYPKFIFKVLKERFSKLMFVSNDVKRFYDSSGEVIYVPSDMGQQVEQLAESTRKKTRQSWGVGEEDILVGYAGRLVGWKGVLTLVQAMATTQNQNIKAVIAGTGSGQEDNIEERVGQLVTSLGLEGRVKLTGFIDDMAPFFKALDIFTLTSVQPEPFATTVVASASAKVPVIATSVGGTSEFVKNNLTGLLVEPAQPEQLKEAIIKLATDKTLRAKLVKEAYSLSCDFTEEKVNTKILKIYEKFKQ